MIYLAIDPSSTCTGYALMRADLTLCEAGLLKPSKREAHPLIRIADMARQLRELIAEEQPGEAVVEVTSGKVGRKHKGRGAGLATYGMAVGYLLRECQVSTASTFWVEENHWTGSTPKEDRARKIQMIYHLSPQSVAIDRGLDACDAIGLARWWITSQPQRKARG